LCSGLWLSYVVSCHRSPQANGSWKAGRGPGSSAGPVSQVKPSIGRKPEEANAYPPTQRPITRNPTTPRAIHRRLLIVYFTSVEGAAVPASTRHDHGPVVVWLFPGEFTWENGNDHGAVVMSSDGARRSAAAAHAHAAGDPADERTRR